MGTLFRTVVEKGGEAQSEAEAAVAALIDSKDQTIIELQESVAELEANRSKIKELEAENQRLTKELHTATTTIEGLTALGQRDPNAEQEVTSLKAKVETLQAILDTVLKSKDNRGDIPEGERNTLDVGNDIPF